MNYSAPELESENEDSASDKDGDECAAAESDDEIAGETVAPSPMKDRTRSKSRKVVIPDALMCSDTEEEFSRPQPRKRNHASPALLRAGGHAKYFRISSRALPARSLQPARDKPAAADESDQFKTARQGRKTRTCRVTKFFRSFVDAAVQNCQAPKGVLWRRPRLSSCMRNTRHYGRT